MLLPQGQISSHDCLFCRAQLKFVVLRPDGWLTLFLWSCNWLLSFQPILKGSRYSMFNAEHLKTGILSVAILDGEGGIQTCACERDCTKVQGVEGRKGNRGAFKPALPKGKVSPCCLGPRQLCPEKWEAAASSTNFLSNNSLVIKVVAKLAHYSPLSVSRASFLQIIFVASCKHKRWHSTCVLCACCEMLWAMSAHRDGQQCGLPLID